MVILYSESPRRCLRVIRSRIFLLCSRFCLDFQGWTYYTEALRVEMGACLKTELL